MKHLDFYKEGTPLFSIKNRWILRSLYYFIIGIFLIILLSRIDGDIAPNPFDNTIIGKLVIFLATFIKNHYVITAIISIIICGYLEVMFKKLYGYHFILVNSEIYRKPFGTILFGKITFSDENKFKKIETKDIKCFVKDSKGFNVITNGESSFMKFMQSRKLVINEIYKIHEDEILQYLNENFTNKEL